MSASVELSPLFDPTLDRVRFPLDQPIGSQRETSAVARRDSPVATRWHALGTNGNDPRMLTR